MSLNATNRYVAKTGNDNNTGTINSPYLTIQKAADMVNPGDSVIVKDGTYSSTTTIFILINRSGTEQNPIVFKSEHKWGAVLDGTNYTSGYCFEIIQGASNLKFIDFEITHFNRDAFFCNDAEYVSSNILIQGNKIRDIGRVVDKGDNAHNAIYIRSKNHHWTITKNLIYNIGRIGPDDYWLNHDHAIYVGYAPNRAEAAHHINVTYNIIWGCSGHALSMGSDYDLYANNIFAWSNENHHEGINLFGVQYPKVGAGFINTDPHTKNITIANNIFYQPSANSSGQPHVIQSYSESYVDWSVKNNIVYGGRMWHPELYNAAAIAVMDGNNYGVTDCENGNMDPLFVSAIKANAPNVNFQLRSDSHAVNAGVDVGLKTDFLDNPIVGLPDIGAYEYSNK